MATCWACFAAPRTEESKLGSEDSHLPTKQCRNGPAQVRPSTVINAAAAERLEVTQERCQYQALAVPLLSLRNARQRSACRTQRSLESQN